MYIFRDYNYNILLYDSDTTSKYVVLLFIVTTVTTLPHNTVL